jgi:poly(3-hydroxybutyrate) depolymerase
VGHYGVFNGRRFREEIYPRIRRFVAQHDDASAEPAKEAANAA